MTDAEQTIRAAIESAYMYAFMASDRLPPTSREAADAIMNTLSQPGTAYELARWLVEMKDGPLKEWFCEDTFYQEPDLYQLLWLEDGRWIKAKWEES